MASAFSHPWSGISVRGGTSCNSIPRGSTGLMYSPDPIVGPHLSQRDIRGVGNEVTPYLTLPNIYEASERTHLPASSTSTDIHIPLQGGRQRAHWQSTDIIGRFEDSSSSSWGTPAVRDRSGMGRDSRYESNLVCGCHGPAAGRRAQVTG